MAAAKDKFMGGIKETIGTVAHAEGLKESGREQKREGDAEALAAGKGKKHYDPALARKGVGIQHKHMGPNPKKLTEGPCAGCKDGTCQIGHDYDAAICHSCTQGHADAGHVKHAGMDTHKADLHGDHVARSAPCCNDYGVAGHNCTGGALGGRHLHQNTATTCTRCNLATSGCRCNTAYDAAACPACNSGNCTDSGHSSRDRAMMKKMDKKHDLKEKELRKKEKHQHKSTSHSSHSTTHDHGHSTTHDHGHSGHAQPIGAHHHHHGAGAAAPSANRVDSDFKRDLEREHDRHDALVRQLDAEDRKDMAKLAPKLHKCSNEYHSDHISRQCYVCDQCGQRLN